MEDHKILSITEELELNWTEREQELNFFKKQLIHIKDDEQKNIFRKSLVLMLYSHYEGFCNFAFNTYIMAVNEENLLRREVHDCLVTASMHDTFTLFEDENYKEAKYKQMFGKSLPNDVDLSRIAKRIHLVTSFDNLLDQTLKIPDKVVNTESNLWPKVLKKLLYKVGLQFNTFREHENTIKHLLRLRNGIAHGAHTQGVEEERYLELEVATFSINRTIIQLILKALVDKTYLK